MSVGHAAAIVLDQFADGDAGRRQLDAGLLHAARNRPGANTGMAGLAHACEPGWPLLDDVTDPPQRLDIVVEGGTTEQADLGDIGRAVARHAAPALDAFQHRALLA